MITTATAITAVHSQPIVLSPQGNVNRPRTLGAEAMDGRPAT